MNCNLIKCKSEETYLAKNGKTYNYQNYYLVLPNGRWVAVKCAFKNDYDKLDTIADISSRDLMNLNKD